MRRKRAPGATVGGILLQLLPAAVLSLLFASVGIVHVCSRVLVVRAGYQMSQLELESRTLAREHDELRLERATLLSPARLERLARDKLGLVPPRAGAVISARRAPDRPPKLEAVTGSAQRERATAVSVANRVGR